MTAPSVQERGGRAFNSAVAASAAGAVVLIVGIFVAPAAVASSYLVAYTATVAVVIGMLLLIMIAHLSGAVWFVLLRRQAEAVVAVLPLVAVLMLPLLIARHAVWPHPYFHPTFFTARAILYWAVWLGFGESWYRLSRRQDRSAGEGRSDRFGVLSAAGIPFASLALTFASFDWMMSLAPDWSSSVYGAYYFTGGMVGALALTAALAFKVRVHAPEWSPTTEHFQAVGRLTLAFVLLWAYLWYVQFFIIWIADIPREAAWYLVRLRSGWQALGVLIVVAGFVVPILVLVFHAARGSARVMGGLGAWLLVMHYLDVYWLVMPSARPRWSPSDLWWDVSAIVFIAGAAIAVGLWRQSSVRSIPVGDPLLEWSLRYEAH